MSNLWVKNAMYVVAVIFLFGGGWLVGQETGKTQRTVVHCVAWTAAQGVSEAGIGEFKKATAELTKTMPGLQRAWVGKLARPFTQGDVTRDYGLVLEFDSVENREAYTTNPIRVSWADVWSKIRVPGSSNFDVIGE